MRGSPLGNRFLLDRDISVSAGAAISVARVPGGPEMIDKLRNITSLSSWEH